MGVRARICEEDKRLKVVEERKRNRQSAKFGKAVGVKRMEERQKDKKDTLKAIEKFKTGRNKTNQDDDAEQQLENVLSGASSALKKNGKGKGKKGKGNGKGGKGKGKGGKG